MVPSGSRINQAGLPPHQKMVGRSSQQVTAGSAIGGNHGPITKARVPSMDGNKVGGGSKGASPVRSSQVLQYGGSSLFGPGSGQPSGGIIKNKNPSSGGLHSGGDSDLMSSMTKRLGQLEATN